MKIARRTSKAEVPSMAMGDIAFNLIIFFVILARAQDDSHLNWEPARAEELESSGAARVSVVIDRDRGRTRAAAAMVPADPGYRPHAAVWIAGPGCWCFR